MKEDNIIKLSVQLLGCVYNLSAGQIDNELNFKVINILKTENEMKSEREMLLNNKTLQRVLDT